MIIDLIAGQIEMISLYKMSSFSETYCHSKCRRQKGLKRATDIVISKFAKQADLANLKSDVDRLDIDKLESTLVDLSKLSNLVKTNVVKNSAYNELFKKVNAIDSNKQILEKKIENFDKKVPDTSKFIVTQCFNKLKKQILMQEQQKH